MSKNRENHDKKTNRAVTLTADVTMLSVLTASNLLISTPTSLHPSRDPINPAACGPYS
jgi:hypothetical protein